jgi:hypothetical protein
VTSGVRLGLRANLAQFSLLVAVNALVGGTLGQERTVVPLLAAPTFHLTDFTAALTFIWRSARSRRSPTFRRHAVGPVRPQAGAGRRSAHVRNPLPPRRRTRR